MTGGVVPVGGRVPERILARGNAASEVVDGLGVRAVGESSRRDPPYGIVSVTSCAPAAVGARRASAVAVVGRGFGRVVGVRRRREAPPKVVIEAGHSPESIDLCRNLSDGVIRSISDG